VFAKAALLWQTLQARAARDFQCRILSGADRLRVAIPAEGISALENRLSLFQGVARAKLIQAHQSKITASSAKKSGQAGTIFGGDSGQPISQNY